MQAVLVLTMAPTVLSTGLSKQPGTPCATGSPALVPAGVHGNHLRCSPSLPALHAVHPVSAWFPLVTPILAPLALVSVSGVSCS